MITASIAPKPPFIPSQTASLASAQSNTEAVAKSEVSAHAGQTEAIHRTTARNIDFHENTRSLVFQTIDPDTGSVIRQFPNETRLKLRAYVEANQSDAVSHLQINQRR